jgi:hypothetical protein
MPLDPEIDKVEERIVRRRHELTRVTQESSRRAIEALASPKALLGAAVLGFVAGGGMTRRHDDAHAHPGRRRNDTSSARRAKRTGVVGALMTGAMWLVRARFGSPAGLAHYLMSRRRQATSARQGWHR